MKGRLVTVKNQSIGLEVQGIETAHTAGEKCKDMESPTILSCMSLGSMCVFPTFACPLKIVAFIESAP